MIANEHHELTDLVRRSAWRIDAGAADAYAPLLDLIGDARFVLIGEASHGTDDFYRMRAELTRRLITEKGFDAVVIEGDWPDAYRINRFVHGFNDDATA